MEKSEFVKERTRIISEMLDNPDKLGIVDTTMCFEKLDELFERVKKRYCMPDNINSKEEHEEYLKVIGVK